MKFGKVLQVEVRVVAGVPKEVGVRVFVHFEEAGAAIKALVDLGVRYFNGNPVFAFFFDEGKFRREELEPPAADIALVVKEAEQLR